MRLHHILDTDDELLAILDKLFGSIEATWKDVQTKLDPFRSLLHKTIDLNKLEVSGEESEEDLDELNTSNTDSNASPRDPSDDSTANCNLQNSGEMKSPLGKNVDYLGKMEITIDFGRVHLQNYG